MTSTGVLVFSTLVLAFCKELAAFFVDAAQIGAGDWDEHRNARVSSCICAICYAF